MPKLALYGGRAVRRKSAVWPRWPVSDAKDERRLAAITRSSRWSYDGPFEWKFAEAFTEYQGAQYGLCCANGTVGLQLALEALDIGAFDEVIVPGLTWPATAAVCLDVNSVPVLVDVEPDSWCIDVRKLEAAITRKTKAVIVVHLYGCVPDMTAIQRLCKRHQLFLVEDCAHQPGTFWGDRGVGTLGDAASFSFQESKVLSSGEGGFITCKSRRLFERLYSLRNCGRAWQGDRTNSVQSGNYRLTEWQAGILLGGLTRLDRQVKRREKNATYLNNLLAEIPGIKVMRRRVEVTQQSYFNFAFRLNNRRLRGVANQVVCGALNAELRTHFGFEPPYEPLHECSLYRPRTKSRHRLNNRYWRNIDPRRYRLPVCAKAHRAEGVVIHHAVLMGTREDMDDIAKAVAKVVENVEQLVC